jgi:cytidylate kinase
VLDTGAMYRAVAVAISRADLNPHQDDARLGSLLDALHLDLRPGQVLLNGEDVTALIRTPSITALASPVAAVPLVRRRLVEWQRAIGARRDLVAEGRDQGTIVFPEAVCKFFMIADPGVRAERRRAEMAARGEKATLEEILRAQEERDRRDAARDLAPMRPADDAIQIDTSRLTLSEVVARMEAEVRRRADWT